jgi:20S proteasome subunit beta 2
VQWHRKPLSGPPDAQLSSAEVSAGAAGILIKILKKYIGATQVMDDAHGVLRGGFSFDLCLRNRSLAAASQVGTKALKTRKTGTTICGCIFKGGIVLGADTRATEGEIICDKNCEKIHYIAPNIYCCGAGTSADTEAVTEMIGRQLELMRLQLASQSRVVTAMTQLKRHLFKYQGQVSAALVLGGCDVTGPHLYTVRCALR